MGRMLVVLLVAGLVVAGAGQGGVMQGTPLQREQGCTVVYASDGTVALGGNNEDYINPRTRVWFIPGEEGGYGRVYFGFDDYHAQGGMNEAGLFFDGLGLDATYPVDKEGKEPYQGNLVQLGASPSLV